MAKFRQAQPVRQPAVRGGHRWQPGLQQRPAVRRVAGRTTLRIPRMSMPRLRAPQLSMRWRRAVAATVALLVLAVGGVLLYHSPAFSVRSVGVKGAVALSPEVVKGVADVEGESVIRPDFEAARERLLALPLVKGVHISSNLLGQAQITIVERAPWGVWQAGSQTFVIDDEGIVLDVPAPAGVPAIMQTDAPAVPLTPGSRVDIGAITVARQLVATAQQTVGRPVTALEFSQASGLTAVFDGGLRATFGDDQGYDFKVAALFAVLQQAQDEGRSVNSVDLRFGERVAIR